MPLRVLSALLVVVLTPIVAVAQALVDRVPADAVVYVGWAGARELDKAYQGSHLQGMVDASQLRQVFEQTWPAVKKRVTDEEPDAAEMMDAVEQTMRLAWRHPVAGYFTSLQPDAIKGAVLVDAGADAEAIEKVVREQMGPDGRGMRVFRLGSIVGWTVGYAEGEMAMAGGDGATRPQPITTNGRFAAAVGQVQKSPALTTFVDVAKLREWAGGLPAGPERQRAEAALRFTDGIDAITMTGGFEGKQWATQTFVAAPAPRKGMATLFEAKPVSDELLRAVPKSTDWLMIRRLDLAKLMTETRASLERTDPEMAKTFDQVVGGASMYLGGNVKDTLFEPLGDEWAIYTAPDVTGVGILGGVLLNKADDASKVNRGITNLALAVLNAANAEFRRGMRNSDTPVQIKLLQHTHNGTKISYVAAPFLTPAWAAKDGILYVGLYPQSVAAAIDAAAAGSSGGSILENPAFRQVRGQLPEVAATSVSFVNLPETAEQSYVSLLMMAQTYMGFADLFGGEGQPLLLPPIAAIKPHLTPSGRVAWVDDAGWHAKTIGPFPMHDLFAGEFSAIGSQYTALSAILLPSLGRARQQAQEVQDVSSLRQIGVAIHMYANDHKGQLPPDLGALVKGRYIADEAVNLFVPADQRGMIPPDLDRSNPDAVGDWVTANTHLVYIRAADRMPQIKQPAQVILVHEPIEGRPATDTVAAAFADGHVEQVPVARVQQLIQQQQPAGL